MRILKAYNSEELLSEDDKKAILGEVMNIMCEARLFDAQGEFIVGEDPQDCPPDPDNISSKKYLSIIVDKKTLTVKPAMGFIILPTGNKDTTSNFKVELEKYLVENIPLYEEKYLKGTKYENYLNNYRCAYADVYSSLMIKPGNTLIKDHTRAVATDKYNRGNRRGRNEEDEKYRNESKNTKIQFLIEPKYDSKRYATFTWYIITIDEFTFEITDNNREVRICERICSVFYDGMDVTRFKHGERTMEIFMSDFRSSTVFVSEEIKFTEHLNPIAEELMSKKNSVKARYHDIKHKVEEIQFDDVEIKIPEDENGEIKPGRYICSHCLDLLYDENYVCVAKSNLRKGADGKHVGEPYCPICMHTGRSDLDSEFEHIYRVRFPLTAREKILSLSVSVKKKDILTQALEKCIPGETKENGILIKYMTIGDKYIAVSGKNHNIKFTRFCSLSSKQIVFTMSVDSTLDDK